jgi:tripartite-type tricarboxylate transporter receptor subunit TctC
MRVVLHEVGKRIGQPIVIENRPGAGGVIAMQAIAAAQPDGYTIGHGNVQTMGISPNLLPAAKVAADKVETVVQVGYTPNLLSVSPKLPVNSVGELVQYAKDHPGKLVYASAGNGTSGHVGGELFKALTKTAIVHIPYRTATSSVNDVMAGHADMVFDNFGGSAAFARAGKLKPLAITSAVRSQLFPEIPTVSEAGVAGFEITAWSGIIAPKGIPKEASQRLNAAVNEVLKEANVLKEFRTLGYEPVGGSGAQFQAWVKSEQDKWGKVIKFANIKTD